MRTVGKNPQQVSSFVGRKVEPVERAANSLYSQFNVDVDVDVDSDVNSDVDVIVKESLLCATDRAVCISSQTRRITYIYTLICKL